MAEFEHIPVLLNEVIDGLNIHPDGIYMDGTVGGGGHSFEIASRLSAEGRLFCFDKDPEAIEAAGQRLSSFPNVKIIRSDFRDAGMALEDWKGKVNGALLDLGVSSHQLDVAERGFSYAKEGELDMRMSDSGMTAADAVNTLSFEELCRILRDYGDENFAPQIANRIIKRREVQPFETTTDLSDVVVSAFPPAVRRKEKHPAKKTFQALRIYVNDEMGALEEGLGAIFDLLAPGGRFCVITFHSIEDRLVKQYFAKLQQGCTCPPEFPVCVCGNKEKAKAVTRKPIIAGETEMETNRRARSAKLRIIEKL
ncbi:MAG: 16S rRNA (cytosine(1402)-N(4))-methyltransferase RsmH [Oscillospiraceae bacterium]|nr:16S rRNA (cytosine(1402)-N(4))-methyltransferase RsmH [Oscillospiraceae bacterium]